MNYNNDMTPEHKESFLKFATGYHPEVVHNEEQICRTFLAQVDTTCPEGIDVMGIKYPLTKILYLVDVERLDRLYSKHITTMTEQGDWVEFIDGERKAYIKAEDVVRLLPGATDDVSVTQKEVSNGSAN